MNITKDLLRELAAHVQLNIPAEEEARYLAELNRMMTCSDTLQTPELDRFNAAFWLHAPESFLRPDTVGASTTRSALLQNAPRTDGETFLVPITVTQGGNS